MNSLAGTLNQATVLQIANIINTQNPFIQIEIMSVQQQQNTIDCAMFAIAFAVEICIGIDVERISFKQKDMRNHLLQCLLNHKITPFPKSDKVVSKSLPGIIRINVYCICRFPDFFDSDMIECEVCKDWFHYKRVTIKNFSNWKCMKCF